MNEMISIVLPIYNSANTVKRTIDSILAQTYLNWELIIVDDGSVDDAIYIVNSYEDERIKYYYQENKGVSAARNKGISIAKGEYITFIDADDYLENNTFQKCNELFSQLHVDAILYAFTFEYETHSEEERMPWKIPVVMDNFKIRDELIPLMVKASNTECDLNGSVCRTMWKKNALDGYMFNEKIAMEEDLLFCIETYSDLELLAIYPTGLYHYVKNNGSATQQYRMNFFDELVYVNKTIKKVLVEKNMWNDSIAARFCGKRVAMYTNCLTNLFRHGAPDDRMQEMKIIVKEFNKDEFIRRYLDYNYVNFSRRITCILMKLKFIGMIDKCYFIKELIRQRKLKKG